MEKVSQKRHSTGYPGITFRIRNRIDGKRGTEKVYYIRYKRPGDKWLKEEVIGRQSEGMTPAKANMHRIARMQGREASNATRRTRRNWTFDKIADDYWQHHEQSADGINQMHVHYNSYYENHLQRHLGHLTPDQLTETVFKKMLKAIKGSPCHVGYLERKYEQALTDDDQTAIDSFSARLQKIRQAPSPATVYNIVQALKALNQHAIEKLQCIGMPYKIKLRRPRGRETELLEQTEIARVVRTCMAWPDKVASFTMRLALFSGMRHGATRRLKWRDINYHMRFIVLRDGKAREADERDEIPLNQKTAELLNEVKKWSKYTDPNDPVIPNRKGQHWKRPRNEALRRLADACGLPKGFRPMHGMRHVFASIAIANGATLTEVQKLLCHRQYQTTLIYTHLKMETLQQISDRVSGVFDQALGQNVRQLRSIK
jgi:integrase